MINIRKIIIVVVVLVLIFSLFAHWLITRPQHVKQFIYPFEAIVASKKSKCSLGAPSWMKDLIQFSFNQRGSLANQIAYRDPFGKIHHCEGGWVDHFFGKPVSEKNRYRYASLTKLITADAILRLVEEKKITLDTPITHVITDIAPVYDSRINDITIAHLLSHSAGFNRLTPEGDVMFTAQRSRQWCPYDVEKLAKQTLHFNPGEKQIYSNLGYCLLGVVIEKITGLTYRDYVEKTYNLDKYNIRFIDGPYLSDEVKYDFRFESLYAENYYKKHDLKTLSAAAGLSGSAISFVQLVEKILSRPGLSILEPPVKEKCKERIDNQCFGFAFDHYQKHKSHPLFIHRGYLPGSSSLVVVDTHGGILVMLNASAVKNATITNKLTIETIYRYLEQEYKN